MVNQSKKKSASSEADMDSDTKEILEEMAAEGLEVDSLNGGKPVDGLEKKPDIESDEEGEADEEPEKEPRGETPETDEDEEGDEADDDDEAEEESEEEDGKPKKLSLVQKYRREKKLRKDAQSALETLQAAKSDEAFDQELAAFAEKSGMDLEVAKGFLDIVAKKAGLPKDLMDDLQQSQKERRNQEYWAKQRQAFDKDFNDNVVPALENLGKTADEIAEIQKKLNTDSKSPFWAWDKKNKQSSLVRLALGLAKTTSNRTSSEGAGNKLNRGKVGKSIAEMSAEEINDMSDEDFDKASDDLGKNSKSVVHRS